MTVPVEVRVVADVPAEGVDQLLHDLRAIGLTPALRAVPVRRGGGELLWWVLLGLPLKPFLDALVQKFADDAYSQLKALVGNVLHRPRGPQDSRRVLELSDNTRHLRVELESDLPLDAYQQLFLVNFSNITQGRLRYDRSSKEWRVERDEWE